jgi:hypothetical protein
VGKEGMILGLLPEWKGDEKGGELKMEDQHVAKVALGGDPKLLWRGKFGRFIQNYLKY